MLYKPEWQGTKLFTIKLYSVPFSPKSPNQAAFDKYGDYPVNQYTGVPEISIPLYTAESGSLKVPITLSYHASGNKVGDAASWVGLGWSLNAGGSISRTILGNPDETTYLGQYQGIKSLNAQKEGGLDSLFGIANNNLYDMRPDIYYYDMPGYSGRFFYDSNNSYKATPIPFSPVDLNDRANVKDEHGNIYRFGTTAKETTSTLNSSGSGAIAGITSWKLERMISQSRRDTITFSYSAQYVTPYEETGQVITVDDLEQNKGGGAGCPIPYAQSPNTRTSNVSATVSEQEISQINFKNGKVVFIQSAGGRLDYQNSPKTLDAIEIYEYNFAQRSYELQRSIKFIKHYYTGLNGVQGKLRLDTLQIRDKGNSVVQQYVFTYDTQPMPSALSYSKDYWGYYNGKMDNMPSNYTLIPRQQVTLENSSGGSTTIYIGASIDGTRDPDTVKMQLGILKSIKYPTGGHTDFAYESNRYIASGTEQIVGGLRIKTIKSYKDNTTNDPITKTYQYDSATKLFITDAAGQLNYNLFMSSQIHRYWTTGGDPSHPTPPSICVTKRVRGFSSSVNFSLPHHRVIQLVITR